MSTTRPVSELSSSSKRHHHFHWSTKVATDDDEETPSSSAAAGGSGGGPYLKHSASSITRDNHTATKRTSIPISATTPRKRLPAVAVARLRSVLSTTFSGGRSRVGSSLGTRVAGTLFGSRKGHVHFAFQREPSSPPAFLIELATPISQLVKEMASGLVRIALECDGRKQSNNRGSSPSTAKSVRLLEETNWRAYCNGKKCGVAAARKECGAKELKLLKSLEMVSMGAGVLPSYGGEGGREEIMYMRAKFERVVGSRDSEAFYMMNPDCNGAPELSIYLLRV
ncbi:Protein MIZU-KUSSEI 1 [Linum perenne]